MLLGNYSILTRNTDRIIGLAFTIPQYTFTIDSFYNITTGESDTAGVKDKIAFPDGYAPPLSFFTPIKSGAIASKGESGGSSTGTAIMAGGVYFDSSVAGSTSATADASMLYHASGTASGSTSTTGTIAGALNAQCSASGATSSTADISAAINASASASGESTSTCTLAGGADLSGTAQGQTDSSAQISAALNASATATGQTSTASAIVGINEVTASATGTTSTSATCEGLGHLSGQAEGQTSGAFTTGATPGFMSGTNVNTEELTSANLAAAVWNSLVAGYQQTGSFGESIAQGSAGLTQQQIRDAMALAGTDTPAAGSIEKLLIELYSIMGLDPTKPLVVTSTTRTAGAEIEQSISEAPAGTVTVTRQ